MKHQRSSLLRAVGASMLAALALTAIAASSAQASGNGLFLVNLANPGTFPVAVTGHSTEKNSLLNLGIKSSCKLASFSGTLTAAAHGKGKVQFKECTTNGEPACLIGGGEITTNDLLGELLLLGTILRIKPLTGTVIAPILYVSPNEDCAYMMGAHQVLNVVGEVCAEVTADTVRVLLKTELGTKHCPTPLTCGAGNVAHFFEDKQIQIKAGANKVTTHA